LRGRRASESNTGEALSRKMRKNWCAKKTSTGRWSEALPWTPIALRKSFGAP